MDNKCPKCGKKLSIFYLKPNCPYCNCDIMQYNMEARLEEDNKKAEKEWAWVDNKLNKIKGVFSRKNKKETKENS